MELLPPSISNLRLLSLLGNILAVQATPEDTAKLRLAFVDREFSWQRLADFAEAQGMIFPLIWSLSKRGLLLPVPAKHRAQAHVDHPTAVLRSAYAHYLERRRKQREQLLAIISTLNAAGITPLLLKGARYLIDPKQAWREARDMRDLDILVREDDGQKALAALIRAGYRSEPDFFPVDQHFPLLMLSGFPSAVELHTEALAYAARKILPTEAVWRHAIRGPADHGEFYILSDEWHLLLGVLHHQVSDRGHARRLLALKGLWEFAALGEELPSPGWHAIAQHMAAQGQLDVLASFIAQAHRLFGLACPAEVAISSEARAHAKSTFTRASLPYSLRRGLFLADQLRFGFSRETMAVRYGSPEQAMSLSSLARHLAFLARYHRGRILGRITGRSDRLS